MIPAFALIVCCDPLVSLDDIERFAVTAAIAQQQWELSKRHAVEMRDKLVGWNLPEVCEAWEAEMFWRIRAWDLLDFVLRCDKTDARKLEHLSELRRLLGEACYAAGWMPSPIPSYR